MQFLLILSLLSASDNNNAVGLTPLERKLNKRKETSEKVVALSLSAFHPFSFFLLQKCLGNKDCDGQAKGQSYTAMIPLWLHRPI